MAAIDQSYDHPNYTTLREQGHNGVIGGTGLQHNLTFRSKVAAVVTGIGVVLGLAATGSLILTLLVDGSVAAILTLCNTANGAVKQFTLTANRTLTAMTSRLEVSTPTHATGAVSVVYQYRVVPGSTFSLNAALA